MSQLQEIDLLTALFCKSKELHPYIIKIEGEFFSERYRVFYTLFQDYYKKYTKPPTPSVFKVDLEGEDRDTALEIFEEIKFRFNEVNMMDQAYLLEKMNLFVKRSFIKKMIVQSYEDFTAEDYDKIIGNFHKINESIVDTNMGSNYYDPEFFMKKYGKERSGAPIRTGSNQFDDTFGGLHRKALTIVAGPSNSGKTMFLVNLAAMLMGMRDELKNILYITLEIDEEQIAKRIDASILGEPVKDLSKKLLSKESSDPLFAKFVSSMENGNRLMIKAMRSGSNPSDIEALIRNLSIVPVRGTDKVFKPDVVLVDYFGLMQPSFPTKNMNTYEKGRSISEDLRAIGQDFNLAMCAAAQTNRGSFGNEVGQDSISDSIAISQTADLMLTLNRNDELDQAGQMMIYLAKSRFSRNNLKFLFSADYECMRLNDIDTGHVGG